MHEARHGLRFSILLAVAVSAISSAARAQGVPDGGFPNWQERTLWVFVNRDRADPETALAACADGGCPDAVCFSGPKPPLAYDVRLGHSARLQPTILAENNVPLMHPSPCVLNPEVGMTYPAECDGGTACVCQTPIQCSNPRETATCSCSEDTSDTSKFETFSSRIQLFAPGSTYYAENIAAGQADPMAVEQAWLQEDCPCCAAYTCGATDCPGNSGSTNGHRYNLMNATENSIGLGAVLAPAGDCYSGFLAGYYWAQDFAFFSSATVYKIVAGSHFPESGSALSFYANWYDPAGAPTKATVVIDSLPHAMTVDRGSGGNATYVYAATLPTSSCKSYSFAFTDSTGTPFVLPGSGAYLAGDTCTADYAPATGGCATGAGDPWFGGVALAAMLLKRQVRARRAGIRPRKLTKWR